MINLTREEAQQVLDALLNYPITEGKAIQLLRAKLSEPEPDPVAWMLTELDGTPLIDCGDLVVKPRPVLVGNKTDCIPLYTAPPQREWVDLTDDEMLMLYAQPHEGFKYSLGRMVQAALKEKNG